MVGSWLAVSASFANRFYDLRGVPWAIVAKMVSAGEGLLYRDLATSLPPLSLDLQALWFKLFPATVNANRWLGALATLVAMMVAFGLVKRLTRSPARAAAAAGAVLIWGAGLLPLGMWGETYYRVAEVLTVAFLALLAWPGDGSWSRAVAAGIVAAGLCFTYQPAGMIVAFTVFLCWLLYLVRGLLPTWRQPETWSRFGFFTLTGVTMLLALPLLYLLLVPAPARADFWLFTWQLPQLYGATYLHRWISVLQSSVPPLNPAAWPSYLNSLNWMLPGAFLAWLGLALVLLRRRAGSRSLAVEVLLAAGLASLLPAVWHPAVMRILVHAAVPLLLATLVLLPPRPQPGRRSYARSLVIAALALFLIAGLGRAVWFASWKSEALFTCSGGSLWMSQADADWLGRTIPVVRAEARKQGGKVYVLGRASVFYLLSGTKPALRYVFNVDCILGPEQYEEQAEQIEHLRPDLVFGIYTVPQEIYSYDSAAALVQVLRNNYTVVYREIAGQANCELLRRRDLPDS